jgi:DNA repair and recombination protein RAD52
LQKKRVWLFDIQQLRFMTATFSAHLMSSYNAAIQSPFGARSATPGPSLMNLQTSGPMSFAPSMHGTPYPSSISQAAPSGSFFSSSTLLPNFATPGEISEATAKRIATLQAKLDQKLGPEYISQRPGPGGAGKLTYAEGWKIINLANEVFGFNGWSSSVVNLTTDFVDYNEETRRFSVAASAIVRVTLADGVYHEDVGCGQVENVKSKAAAIDKVWILILEICFY